MPSSDSARRVDVGASASAPLPDNAPPRNRVFAKQPRQLRRKQQRSELDVSIRFGSPENVVAHRLQFGGVAMVLTSQALEEDELELVSLQNLQVLVRGLKKLGEVAAQKRELQICRDPVRFRQPIADKLLDDAVGHDNRHPL